MQGDTAKTGAPEVAQTLLSLAQRCDACERSWSVHDAGCDERLLLYFDNADDMALQLARAARMMGYPAPLLADWSRALPGADAIGIGFHRDLRSVRLYVQYWDRLAAQVAAGDASPAPLYAGFKALPSGTTRIDAYLCLPLAPAQVYGPPLSATLQRLGVDAAAATAAFARLSPENAIFTVTDDCGRQSWLITLRRAQIAGADLAASLAPLAGNKATAPIADAAARGLPLVHVAGGQDGEKGAFSTLYFECSVEEAARVITAAIPQPDSPPPRE